MWTECRRLAGSVEIPTKKGGNSRLKTRLGAVTLKVGLRKTNLRLMPVNPYGGSEA
jgi:hypothetical protein